MVLNVHRNHVLLGTGRGGGDGGEVNKHWCLTSTETTRLIRGGENGGKEVGGEGDYIYLSLHCHHQNDFCIKMGSEESHFNVSVGSDGQSHKTVSTNHNF